MSTAFSTWASITATLRGAELTDIDAFRSSFRRLNVRPHRIFLTPGADPCVLGAVEYESLGGSRGGGSACPLGVEEYCVMLVSDYPMPQPLWMALVREWRTTPRELRVADERIPVLPRWPRFSTALQAYEDNENAAINESFVLRESGTLPKPPPPTGKLVMTQHTSAMPILVAASDAELDHLHLPAKLISLERARRRAAGALVEAVRQVRKTREDVLWLWVSNVEGDHHSRVWGAGPTQSAAALDMRANIVAHYGEYVEPDNYKYNVHCSVALVVEGATAATAPRLAGALARKWEEAPDYEAVRTQQILDVLNRLKAVPVRRRPDRDVSSRETALKAEYTNAAAVDLVEDVASLLGRPLRRGPKYTTVLVPIGFAPLK